MSELQFTDAEFQCVSAKHGVFEGDLLPLYTLTNRVGGGLCLPFAKSPSQQYPKRRPDLEALRGVR
jgi:hypothetical protein